MAHARARRRRGGGRIREQEPAGTNVPIIAITASVVAGDQHDCLDAGMDEVLVKPVPIEALRAALARHVSLAPTPTTPVPSPSRRINQAPTSIDRRALDELELETGDRSVVGVIIDTYLDELEPRLSTIGAAADVMVSGDQAAAKELMRSSHTLKSTAALVGATRLSHLCEQLQVLASDRPGPEAVRLAELVVAEARRTAIDLQTVRSTL
ncbi:MAG: response regulator [Acidimicrobiales bacterium]